MSVDAAFVKCDTTKTKTEHTVFDQTKTQMENENIDGYDSVFFTICDIFGRPQGKFAVGGDSVRRFTKEGMETPFTTCVLGLHSEHPETLPSYNRTKNMTCRMFPDLNTLKPLSWLCTDVRKVGHMLCDLYDSKGQHDLCSPRAVALKQLDMLRNLGYQIMTSFETEFIIFLKGTLKAYGGDEENLMNMIRLDSATPFIYDLTMGLQASGIPVETYMEEWSPGQMEYSLKPQYGIEMADTVHRLRYVIKSLCERNGLEPSFMPRVSPEQGNNGFHLNHSLWTLDGKNAFHDPDDAHKCSKTMHHWIAGLIHHGNALTALMCPTVNCYERLHGSFAASDNMWNYNDRQARLRVKNKGTNIHIEDRTPSSACNPYLCLAGLVAAGADGIARKLEAIPPRIFRPLVPEHENFKAKNPLPKSLEESLQALEQDSILVQSLGEEFVQNYISICREFQLEKLKDTMTKEPKKKLEAQRNLYFHSL